MTQGKISGNTCKNGTIYQAGGTMTLAGGSITGNTCTESGGGGYHNGGDRQQPAAWQHQCLA